jgi:hypothetical protein
MGLRNVQIDHLKESALKVTVYYFTQKNKKLLASLSIHESESEFAEYTTSTLQTTQVSDYKPFQTSATIVTLLVTMWMM